MTSPAHRRNALGWFVQGSLPFRPSIDARFAEFHAAHPQVWAAFCEIVAEAIASGCKHLSSDDVLHQIRWRTNVQTNWEGGFKINNDFSSRYARLWQQANPERASLFETRNRRAS